MINVGGVELSNSIRVGGMGGVGPIGIINPLVFNIRVAAGLFDFSWDAPGRVWEFPDGTISTDVRPTRTLATGGTVVLRSPQGWGGDYALTDNDSNPGYIGDMSDIPPVTYSLSLFSCVNATGSYSDIPRATWNLNIALCANVAGDLSSSPPVRVTLNVRECPLIYGIIPTTVIAHQIYLQGTGMSQTDLEQSLINVDSVAAPVAPSGAIFNAATGMPTITDPIAIAAAASLRVKGWTVNVNE